MHAPSPVRSILWPALALSALLAGCTGEGTLAEVRGIDDSMGCDADGGVCEGGVAEPEVVRVDCCDIQTNSQQALCDDLYGGTVPENLIVEDVCNGEPEPEEPEEDGEAEEDPCEGLTGIEAIFCDVDSLFPGQGEGEQADPCAGLTGTNLLICQVGSELGLDTSAPEPVTGPFADVVNGLNALADIANGFNTLAELLGLENFFGGLFGGGEESGMEGETEGDASDGSGDGEGGA